VRLGAARALSLDARLGLPGLGSLRVRGASPSRLRLLPQLARGHGRPLAEFDPGWCAAALHEI